MTTIKRATPVRLLQFRDLKIIHGIDYSRQHLRNLERQKKFPRRVTLGERRIGWVETEIVAYLDGKLLGRM